MSKIQSGEFIKSFDENKIFCRTWDKVKEPKGVVMIIHGMVEHSGRYDDFAKFLNKNGFVVFAWDLRAHGQTVGKSEDVGKYSGDLFVDCVNDAMFFANLLNEKYNLPLVVLGHSFGSFLLQSFIEKYHNYSVAVFSGSANMAKGASVGAGLFVAGLTKFFCGKNAKAKTIYNMSFKSYGKNFKDGNWLTRDEKIWQEYNQDEFCGNICSANFYYSMFKNLKKVYKKENLEQISKEQPILIVSGDKDPVGQNGVLVEKLKNLYDSVGVKNVKLKLFEDGRHEILNETNKQEVWQLVLDFLNANLNKQV